MKAALVAAMVFFAASVSGAYAQAANADAEIFTTEDTSKSVGIPSDPVYMGEYGEYDSFLYDKQAFSGKDTTLYSRSIARWRDVATAPHSRMVCVKWAEGKWPWGGRWKTCIGHKYQYQWLYVTATLKVQTSTPKNIGQAVTECFDDAVVAAAAAAILTSGSAAIPTFETVMKGCLAAKLTSSLVFASVATRTAWGPWE